MISLKLPNVTLVVVSGVNYQREECREALRKSCEEIEWAEAKHIEVESIKNINDWNYFLIYKLYDYIHTDFAMLIHADGWVVNPQAWRDEFLAYDYIGAPWPLPQDDYSYRTEKGELVRVGNSVSLRSKRIMSLPTQLRLEWKSYYGNTNEDGFLCVHNRDILEQHGIKFADIDIAKYFSKEHEIEENKGIETFAFHSL